MYQPISRVARRIILYLIRKYQFLRGIIDRLYYASLQEHIHLTRASLASEIMGSPSPVTLPMLSIDENRVQNIYDSFTEYTEGEKIHPDVISQISAWQKGTWKNYLDNVLKQIPLSFQDKTVVDFGCKYGLLFPLLFEAGVKRVIGIEHLDWIIQEGKKLCEWYGINAEFMKAEDGYVALQPETVDIIIMNEVISHIPPTVLPTVYSEAARILAPGGVLFISDGNNLGYPPYFDERLIPLYEALERGPDGTKIEDLVVKVCFMNQRKAMIQKYYPDLSEEQLDHLSENTFRLFGERLHEEIERYIHTGELIRRPYRKGMAPAYPDSGMLEERGFYPEQVVFELMEYGFHCTILTKAFRTAEASVLYGTPNFQIVGVKKY
jgi:2-polyprenyl-3-methyl-5-hydroxy-6-metoxy-1,4-benzoquinol methylase